MDFAWWKILWSSPRIRYWTQRADFTTTDFPPATFKEALAALFRHDWSSDLELMRSLENTEQDFCMPGIGFVFQEGRVLHICPNHDATATCFYIADDRSLHRAAVSAREQADLLRLFYRQERARLIQAFGETVPADPWWHDMLRRLFSFARPAIIFVIGAFVVISAIIFIVAISDGVPPLQAFGRLLSGAPFLLLMQVAIVAGGLLFLGPIFLVMMLFERKGWKILLEGQDHTGFIIIAVGIIIISTLLGIPSGKWSNSLIQFGHFSSLLGAFLWPI
jgi:hypothetical protein